MSGGYSPSPQPETLVRIQTDYSQTDEDILMELEFVYEGVDGNILKRAAAECEGDIDTAMDLVGKALEEIEDEPCYVPEKKKPEYPPDVEEGIKVLRTWLTGKEDTYYVKMLEDNGMDLQEAVEQAKEIFEEKGKAERLNREPTWDLTEMETQEGEITNVIVNLSDGGNASAQFVTIGFPPYHTLAIKPLEMREGYYKETIFFAVFEGEPLVAVAKSIAQRICVDPDEVQLYLMMEGEKAVPLSNDQSLQDIINGDESIKKFLDGWEHKAWSENEFEEYFGAVRVCYMAKKELSGTPEKVKCHHCSKQYYTRARLRTNIKCTNCQQTWSRAEERAARAIAKACPNCGFMILRYHGHGCHSTLPSGGCPKCKQPFCYVCLAKHGTPGHYQINCMHGHSFCSNSDIARNIIISPFPVDKRCGCSPCPTCQPPMGGKPAKPCPMCDSNCIVCLGLLTEEQLVARLG